MPAPGREDDTREALEKDAVDAVAGSGTVVPASIVGLGLPRAAARVVVSADANKVPVSDSDAAVPAVPAGMGAVVSVDAGTAAVADNGTVVPASIGALGPPRV